MTSLQQQQQEALERAKAIAAKLSSTVGDNANKKRKWGDIIVGGGVASSTASGTTATTSTSGTTGNITSIPGMEPKRIWIRPSSSSSDGATKKPLRHFALYLKEPLVELKQKYSASAAATTNASSSSFEIQMELKGRGSTDKPPLPGIPEEPLHVLVVAPRMLLAQLETDVEDLIAAAEQAPLQDGAEEWERTRAAMYGTNGTVLALTAANTANNNNNNNMTDMSFSSNIHTTTSTHTTSSYRPASVAQLIGQANLPMEAQYLQLNSVQQEEQMQVPNNLVGYIIGRGGENIASMQARTGARVQIQKEHELVPGQTHRVITVSGPTTEAVEKCKAIIQGLVQERSNRNPSMTMNSDAAASLQNAAAFVLEVDVPDADVGLIIGKSGATIKAIQEETGANIQIPQSATSSSSTVNAAANGTATTTTTTTTASSVLVRTVKISHATSEQGAALAKQRILDILQQRNQHHHNNNNYKSGALFGGKQASIQISIPDKDVGLCIGRQGCVIRHMQSTTNTRIQIPQHTLPGEAFRVATVTGPEEGCKLVQQMIQSIIVEQSSASVMSGTYGAQEQYYSGQAAVAGQEAYSADWAAYHAAQAAAAAAAAATQHQNGITSAAYPSAATTTATDYYGTQQQQQQYYQNATSTSTATSTTTTASAGTATAADTYYEPFFRYAYYYGEEAARQYYGAWSPPPGTPNPYGINPNGIQPAPAVESTATNTTATTTTATQPATTTTTTIATTIIPQATSATASDVGLSTASTVQATASSYPTSSQASAAASQARETGRRKVSNLPAWMTKK